MKKSIKQALKKTGAILASTAIVASFLLPASQVQALDNEIITKIETGASLTIKELNRALKDDTTSKEIEKELLLGKNIVYRADIKDNITLTDLELQHSIDSNYSDVLVEYNGLKADTSTMPVKVYYEYRLLKDTSGLEKGIDVSSWQGKINWDEVSKHIDFAIIRVMDAIRRDSNGKFILDEQFHRNMKECERLNIPVGAYWFSRATTEEAAKKEANFVGKVLEGYTLEYPTYIDVECESQLNLDDNTLRNVISAANKEILKYKLYPAIYINNTHANRVEKLPYQLWLTSGPTYNNKVSFQEFSNDNFEVYYTPNKKRSNYQYSSKGNIPGISGYIDMDYALGTIKNEISNSQDYKARSR